MALRAKDYPENAFPHTCKVYRMINEDEFTDGTIEVIYEGKCRDDGNKAMRGSKSKGVMQSFHALQIPTLLLGVTNECMVDITNYCGTIEGMTINSCQPCQFGEKIGTTIYYNESKN